MKEYVSYREFGAIGDGKTDDMAAIVATHEYANKNHLPVKADPDANYYIGEKDLTARIETDTDWGNAHFTVCDINVENRDASLFFVPAMYETKPLLINSLSKDQKKISATAEGESFVMVRDDTHLVFRRKGVNRSDGVAKSDRFLIDSEGNIKNDLSWDFAQITSATVRLIEDKPLTISGGFFETIANTCESKYNYHARNIRIARSKVTLSGITHRVVNELDHGAPYGGFLVVGDCAHVVLRDCSLTGHRIYMTPGYGGASPMGSYDINIHGSIDVSLISITQVPEIMDRTRWGLMGTNFCKNLRLENCTISRFDAHMGVTNAIIRGCSLGWQNVCVIGNGKFIIEDTSVYGGAFVSLRYDYGSHFDGDMIIRHCRWIPAGKNPAVIWASNEGDHDFGYTCRMPRNITIDGLVIDDTACPDAENICVFGTYDKKFEKNKPYAYIPTEYAKLHDIKTLGGTKVKLCLDPLLYESMETDWS